LASVMAKQAVGDRIIEHKSLFQVRSGRREPADKEQVSTRGEVTQNESGGIVALAARTEQIFI